MGTASATEEQINRPHGLDERMNMNTQTRPADQAGLRPDTNVQSSTQTAPLSKKRLWAGRITSAIPVLFLLIDGVAKLFKPASIVEATVQLGYPESVIVGLGILFHLPTNTSSRLLLGPGLSGGSGTWALSLWAVLIFVMMISPYKS